MTRPPQFLTRRRSHSRLDIYRAIPAGHARAAGQYQWLAAVGAHPETAGLRADGHRNLLAVAKCLASFTDWTAMTSRPTWAVLQQRTGLSRPTVARWLRWLHTHGLLATVVHGTTSQFSPGVLRDVDQNDAAVYVLCYRSALVLVPGIQGSPGSDVPVDRTETPSGFSFPKGKSPTRTREIRNHSPRRTHRSDPAWSATQRPASKPERALAASEAQRRIPLLRRISTPYAAALFREAFLAGWTLSDVLYALDHRPGGELWPHTAGVRNVPGWVRYRLAAWRVQPTDPRSPLTRSPSQLAAVEAARLRALARARTERHAQARAAATPPTEAGRWAATVRAELRAAQDRRQSRSHIH